MIRTDTHTTRLPLTDADKKQLLAIARDAIVRRITGTPAPASPPCTDAMREQCGAFVTLHRNGQLRGCIGTIQAPKPLYQTVHDMAQSAAFHDPRFDPVSSGELSSLEIEISVLTPLREIQSPDDIIIGMHGLLLVKGNHSGLLLPQVATEQGWNRDEFIDHTCMKAGLPTGSWKEPDARLFIFSAEIFNDSPDMTACNARKTS